MTRYPPQQKEKTKERIVRAAGRLFRAKGFQASGVDAVMKAVGLTHGGFYSHFRSKQALFAEAVRDAVLQSGEQIDAGLEGLDPEPWLVTFVEHYLSAEHLARPKDGCPLPSLLSEIDRAPKAVKSAFEEAGQERVASLAERYAALGAEDPAGEALATFSALAGAMAMARAMPTSEQAEGVMEATRSRLKATIAELAAG